VSDYSDYNVPAMSAAAAETHASILSLPRLVNDDAGLVRRGRYLTATFLVEAGETEFLVRVAEGRLASVERGPFLEHAGHAAPPMIRGRPRSTRVTPPHR
jgi:hypothetical protein